MSAKQRRFLEFGASRPNGFIGATPRDRETIKALQRRGFVDDFCCVTQRGREAAAVAAIRDDAGECEGHPAGPNDPMGETVFCDGSCQGGAR